MNIFDSLYYRAQTQIIKKKEGEARTKEEIEYEKNKSHCTFKPDLNKTKKVNKKVERCYKTSR